MNAALAVAAVPTAFVVLVGGALSSESEETTGYTLEVAALPTQARESLATLEAARVQHCPELPLVWLVAQIQVESGWDPRAYSTAGAAGLLQLLPGTWSEAGGDQSWAATTGPAADHPVWVPAEHLDVALPWICANLRTVAEHLTVTDKPTPALDAMAVCHVAGCSRVTGSVTGVPDAGEAGCDELCAATVRAYLDAIHDRVADFSRPVPDGITSVGPAAAPWTGGTGGCTVPDPTGTGGCVTPATAWLIAQVALVFGDQPVSCWDAHAWNPDSDHPRGRACDYTIGAIGTFPDPSDTALGWSLAQWLRTHAVALHVDYLIWQGRIWSTARADNGWRAYTGGGVYDPHDPTGGHYDHVHVSTAT
jgi:hypothetical protein